MRITKKDKERIEEKGNGEKGERKIKRAIQVHDGKIRSPMRREEERESRNKRRKRKIEKKEKE